jgi:hypothetical protein
MARRACGFVFGVTENDEVRQHIDRLFGRYYPRQIQFVVADLAFLGIRKPSPFSGFGVWVAGDALQFQGRVAGVAELHWGSGQRYGSE